MRNPIKILVKSEMLTLEGIAQYFIALEDDDQKFVLKIYLIQYPCQECIIYCTVLKEFRNYMIMRKKIILLLYPQ